MSDKVAIKKSKDMIKQIISEDIKDENIKYVVNLAFNKVSPKFWEVPENSTGKSYPPYAQGVSGLARHTIAAVHFCKRMFKADLTITQDEKDLVLAAMLLHDTCKMGLNFEEEYTVYEHPILVQTLLIAEDLLNYNLQRLWLTINIIIASHMGRWNEPTNNDMLYRREQIVNNFAKVRQLPNNFRVLNNYDIGQYLKLPLPTSKLENIVSLANFMASDKDCNLTIFD